MVEEITIPVELSPSYYYSHISKIVAVNLTMPRMAFSSTVLSSINLFVDATAVTHSCMGINVEPTRLFPRYFSLRIPTFLRARYEMNAF